MDARRACLARGAPPEKSVVGECSTEGTVELEAELFVLLLIGSPAGKYEPGVAVEAVDEADDGTSVLGDDAFEFDLSLACPVPAPMFM